MLTIEHLTKTYGDTKAVDDLSLHIAPGEIYGFIGHNGAGKTTTLKSCAGILPFDQGQIRIDGRDIVTDPLGCKQRMAYIPDNPDIYEYMSGIRFLNFIGDIYRVEPTVRRERIHTYAGMLGIENDLAQPVSAFSHGMKQKLALIAAWIHEPRLILMDEPFVGLDPKAAFLLKELMHEHCQKGGAIFFSTHVLDVAEKLCDKVAIIKEGRLIASGSMDEVKGDASLEDVFLELGGVQVQQRGADGWQVRPLAAVEVVHDAGPHLSAGFSGEEVRVDQRDDVAQGVLVQQRVGDYLALALAGVWEDWIYQLVFGFFFHIRERLKYPGEVKGFHPRDGGGAGVDVVLVAAFPAGDYVVLPVLDGCAFAVVHPPAVVLHHFEEVVGEAFGICEAAAADVVCHLLGGRGDIVFSLCIASIFSIYGYISIISVAFFRRRCFAVVGVFRRRCFGYVGERFGG